MMGVNYYYCYYWQVQYIACNINFIACNNLLCQCDPPERFGQTGRLCW